MPGNTSDSLVAPDGPVVAVLQARMGSQRLPGKILMPVAGIPLIGLIARRLMTSTTIDAMVVATSNEPSDDVTAEYATATGLDCFRGSEADCLDRVYNAARLRTAKTVIRLTGDNPFIDGEFVDSAVSEFARVAPDLASTTLSNTFAYGLSVEVMRFDALARAWREAASPEDREHVTRYMYIEPDRFHVHPISSSENTSSVRMTVDTPSDLEIARRAFDMAGPDAPWRRLLVLIRSHPEWTRQGAED